MEYRYKYPHAAITADCVIYGFDGERLKILLALLLSTIMR